MMLCLQLARCCNTYINISPCGADGWNQLHTSNAIKAMKTSPSTETGLKDFRIFPSNEGKGELGLLF